jgi:hypothetical protein
MKSYINKDKIIQAFIVKPTEYDKDCPFSVEHGWQVKFLISFSGDGYPNFIVIDLQSEDECLECIKKLDLIEI